MSASHYHCYRLVTYRVSHMTVWSGTVYELETWSICCALYTESQTRTAALCPKWSLGLHGAEPFTQQHILPWIPPAVDRSFLQKRRLPLSRPGVRLKTGVPSFRLVFFQETASHSVYFGWKATTTTKFSWEKLHLELNLWKRLGGGGGEGERAQEERKRRIRVGHSGAG